MAAVGHHRQRRRGDLALHQHRGRQAGPVLVAGEDERGHGHGAHLVQKVVERRALALHADLGVGRTKCGMLAQLLLELGEAARVLVLELHACRAIGVFAGELLHALAQQRLGDDLDLALELGLLLLLRAVADAGHDQRQRPRGMAEAEMQGGEAAHRQAHDMGLLDLQVIHHRQDVVGGAVLRIARGLLGHVGRRIAAGAEGDAAVALAEMAHLHFPRAVVGRELVHEDDGRAGAGLLVIELHPIVGRRKRHGFPRIFSRSRGRLRPGRAVRGPGRRIPPIVAHAGAANPP